MNLIEVKDKIISNINNIEYKSSYISATGDYSAQDLQQLRSTINSISDIELIRPEIKILKDSWIFQTSADVSSTTPSENSQVASAIARIKVGFQFILRIIGESDYYERQDVVYIRLPDIDTFEELSKISSELKKGIEIPLNDSELGNLNIITAESGSIWLVVSLGALAGVKLIAAICWAAVVIRKKNAEAKIFEEHAKSLSLKNEAISDFINAQKVQISNILDSEAKSIANKHYNHEDPETIERLKLSISTVSGLIEKGTQILPASPEGDIKKMFPDYNALGLIESSIRQITGTK